MAVAVVSGLARALYVGCGCCWARAGDDGVGVADSAELASLAVTPVTSVANARGGVPCPAGAARVHGSCLRSTYLAWMTVTSISPGSRTAI